MPTIKKKETAPTTARKSEQQGKVYVGNLSFRTDNRSLYDAFSKFGDVLDASVVMDRMDRTKSRGFAFVTFKHLEDAKKACLDMDGKDLDGRQIRVDLKQGDGGSGGGNRSRGSYDSNRGRNNNYSGGSGANAAPVGGGDRRNNNMGTPPSRAAPTKPSSESAKKPSAASTNCRVYISGLPTKDVTEDDIQKVFGMLGEVQRIKQRRGYKDQWPWKIKMYRDEKGEFKGDCIVSYEDPNAARTAPEFFNGYDFNGHKLTVVMAKEYVASEQNQQAHGGRGDNNRRRDDRHRGGGGRRDYDRRDGGYRGRRR